jgi:L-alanine-DL-glutamate epimerase-like enolase superfamily enzyme
VALALNTALEAAIRRLVHMGFRQMKMQCGSEPTVRGVGRARARRAPRHRPDVDLMCDINQLWSVHHAIEVGRRVEAYQLFWLEVPTAHDDFAGLARVADSLSTPIAAGEYHYGIVPFRHLLEARSIDIVMIDLLRVGGITQWMKVAGMAEAFNLPVVSHLILEIHVHLVSAIPKGLTVECMPWSEPLFKHVPPIDNGMLVVPDEPALGLDFDAAVIERYEVK